MAQLHTSNKQKSLFILVWDEKAFIFRGSTQLPRLLNRQGRAFVTDNVVGTYTFVCNV
jgi:hypothetical protein